jgi:hypothetical protein
MQDQDARSESSYALSAAGGNDAPEAYNLVFQNGYTPDTGGDIGWCSGTRKFVIVLTQPRACWVLQCLSRPARSRDNDPAGRDECGPAYDLADQQTSLMCYQSLGQRVPGGSSLASPPSPQSAMYTSRWSRQVRLQRTPRGSPSTRRRSAMRRRRAACRTF